MLELDTRQFRWIMMIPMQKTNSSTVSIYYAISNLFSQFLTTLYFTNGWILQKFILVYSKFTNIIFYYTLFRLSTVTLTETHTLIIIVRIFLCWFINICTHGFSNSLSQYNVGYTFVRWMESRMHIFRMNFDSSHKKYVFVDRVTIKTNKINWIFSKHTIFIKNFATIRRWIFKLQFLMTIIACSVIYPI